MPTPPPLARIALARIALRLCIVAFLVTGIGFWYAYAAYRDASLANMERNISLRLERENQLFRLAEDNLLLLRDRYVKALAAPPPSDLDARFAARFERKPDGTIRHLLPGHDTHLLAGGYVSRNVPVTAAVKHRLLVQQDMATQYGLAWEPRFVNTYIASLDGVFATFLPDTDWAAVAPPEIEKVIRDYPWVRVATPEADPKRRPAWTAVYLDEVAKKAGAAEYYYITCTVPIDEGGRFAHYAGLDLSLHDIIAHNEDAVVPGAWNLIFTSKGQLIAHPGLTEAILAHDGDFQLLRDGDDTLRRIWRLVGGLPAGSAVIYDQAGGQYLGYGFLPHTGWYFVTVLPEKAVTGVAWQVAQVLLALGGCSLGLELALFRMVLRRQVEKPLGTLVAASGRLAGGDWSARLPPQRSLELDKVAQAFNAMAEALSLRDGIIRNHASEQEALVEERTAELRAVFDSGPVPMLRILGERIADANKASEQMFGHGLGELTSLSLADLLPRAPGTGQPDAALLETLRLDGVRRLETPMRRADGSTFWGLVSTAHVDRHRPGLGYVLLCEDISDRLAKEEESFHKATHDALTGLPNRLLLEDHLAQALASAARNQSLVGLLFIDLDRFKAVNDRKGHEAGDAVLRECARRLRACLRVSDVVARWGGDEFVVLLVALQERNQAMEAASRVIRALREAFVWDDGEASIGASVGIAIAPAHGGTPEGLIRSADMAMYRAKMAGGGRWVVSDGWREDVRGGCD
ncbi:MAG: diguanylate cyclase domain-containing protein [Solidesulfovibrio sp. DCME]|uniref:diguanylate cyclase domain-containing protein n=1 Tax=Solidesulfovibrio sp. DCME TaxID=3447380 RepID=UPI003D144B24